MNLYTQLQIINILISCDTATELMNYRELLEETGHSLQSVAMQIYDTLMSLYLVAEKI